MKPNRVPQELIDAGFDAIGSWYAAHPDHNSYLDDRTQMRLVIAAVLTVRDPQVERLARERLLAELELKPQWCVEYTHTKYGSRVTDETAPTGYEATARGWLRDATRNNGGDLVGKVKRRWWSPWHIVNDGIDPLDRLTCWCPHNLQPDGTLVCEDVVTVGCPMHDSDAVKRGSEEAGDGRA